MFSVVVAKYLLVNVAFKMKRLYSNVGSLQSALEQTLEVFDSVGVNLPVDISLHVIHNVMHEVVAHLVVADRFIGVDLGAMLHFAQESCLQGFALYV